MLQETHFPSRFSPSFLHARFPSFYLANAEDKTRGVAILFSKDCQFKVSQTRCDPEGRYILVKGQIADQTFSLISYYAPNKGQNVFFTSLFQTLGPLLEGTVIFGGDSNVAFDQSLDKSKPPAKQLSRPTKISSKIAKLIHQQGLTDIWRELNPTSRDYSHYSIPHQVYSRIDHILISSMHIPAAISAKIKDTPLSDHSMISLSIQGSLLRPSSPIWRIKEHIIKDPIQISELTKTLNEYFLLNNVDNISAETLWAAHKVVIRGKLIQISSQLKKERTMDIAKLERDFLLLRKNHKANPSLVQPDQLDAARIKLNLALTVKAEDSLRWNGVKFYLNQDKMSTMLASKLSPRSRLFALPKIKLQDGTSSQNPHRILESFQAFYSQLYKANESNDSRAIEAFLEHLPIPTIQKSHKEIMEAQISVEETLEVIKNLKGGSAPGPDGLSNLYYKTFAATLAPHLTKMFNYKRKGDPIDPQMNAAFITVIPKPDKNPDQVENYRPISLINNDLKILTKIYANRLNTFINTYIHKDQVGFIPGRQGPDQVRRAIDIASILHSGWDGGPKQEGLFLSLDLQKAFDSVSWPFIFASLRFWGFGEHFIGILKSLYSEPEARVKLQGFLSSPIKIARGTRQGCPLSPLIFALIIETLAIAIRSDPNIKGVNCGLNTHKCALFADDLLLFVTSPITTLPNINGLLQTFGEVSGLRVNMTKSQALNISLNPALVERLKLSFNFNWSDSSIRYLGINLTPSIDSLYQANFPPMYRRLEEDIRTWSPHKLSWLGRIHAIKMTLFPRILYLFRALPIAINRNHLKRFQGKIIKFIWGGKGYRFSRNTLYAPKSKGGLGLPELFKYYQAARLAQLSTLYFRGEKPDWIQIERQAVPSHTLDYLLWTPSNSRPPIMAPTLSHSFRLWDSLIQNSALTSQLRPLSHIFRNPLFKPGLDIKSFQW